MSSTSLSLNFHLLADAHGFMLHFYFKLNRDSLV